MDFWGVILLVCTKCTKTGRKIVRIGYSASLEKVCKLLLTFVGGKVYIIQGCWTRQQTTEKQRVLRAFFERAKTSWKKLKKLLTKKATHDIIQKLSRMSDKQN